MSRQPTSAFSVAMLAERWGTSDTFVYDQISRGNLRAFKLGAKLIRISAEAVAEYEAAGELAKPEPTPQAIDDAAPMPKPADIGRLMRRSMN